MESDRFASEGKSMTRTSREVAVKVGGELACFTRPEYAAERVSYPCITPPAAQGLLSAIFWKPEFTWRVTQIELLAEPKWASMLRNEVSERASIRRPGIDILERRVQRHSLLLRDVAYIIRARAELRAHADAPPAKYTDQFTRRVERGAFFTPPYLGLREYPAWFSAVSDTDIPSTMTLPLGPMILDLGYSTDGTSVSPVFFNATIQNGTLVIPHPDELSS
jgi:CRISPR-associated protein Cas5d